MEIVIGLLKVVAGTFILFTLARTALLSFGTRSRWAWVVFVGALAVTNMVVHRLMGSSINPPGFTAVFLGVTLLGLNPKDAEKFDPLINRALIALAIGTGLGWLTYAEVVSM